MKADALADPFRLQDIALDELAGKEEHDDDHQVDIVRPELHERHPGGQHQADGRADIGDEAQEPGQEADQQAEIEADQRQADGVVDAEEEAERALAAHEAGNGACRAARAISRTVAT